MYGKRHPCTSWLLLLAAILFCYTSPTCSKPYRQEIQQNKQENNKTIPQATNNPSVHLDKVVLESPLNSKAKLSETNKNRLKPTAKSSGVHESVIFKAIVSNVDVLTVQEGNSSGNGLLSKHSTEIQQEENDINESSRSSNERPSKAHLKWDGHVVAAPLKYDPYARDFQTPKKVSDIVSTSKMVLSLLTAAAALGSIVLTVAIFQCCCRKKRTSDDEEDDDQIETDQCNKEKATITKQSVDPVTSEKDASVEPTTTDGEAVQKDGEEKEEEEQVSVKDKIKAFETQAFKAFSTENVNKLPRPLIKRPENRASADCEKTENLSASTSLIMGQVFRKRADTEKCQRKEAPIAPEVKPKEDDYFGMIGRETEVLKSYRRAPAPRNRTKASKALHRKTMPNLDSGGRPNMEISMSDWESSIESFHQTASPFAKQEKQEPKKKTPLPLPVPNQKEEEDVVDNKLEDATDTAAKTETKTEESMLEMASETNAEKSRLSTGDNTPDASSSGDETSQGEERKIKEEIKGESDKEEKKEEEKVEIKKEEKEDKEQELENYERELEKDMEEREEMENYERELEKDMEEREEMEKEKKLAKEKLEEEEKLKKENMEEKLKKENMEKKKKLKEEKEKLKEEDLNKEKEKDEESEKEKETELGTEKEKEKELMKKKEDKWALKMERERELKRENERKLKEEREKELKEEEEREMEREKERALKNEIERKLKEEREKEIEIEMEKEREMKEKELKEKELKQEKDEAKREKEELNKLEKEVEKNSNIFFQIDPTAEQPTAAKLVKRDSDHESNETSVQMRRHTRGDSPQNDQSPQPKRHLSHLERKTMFALPGQKPEDQMSLMLSLKEKLNDKKENKELDEDTDTKMEVDPEPETEKSQAPES